MWRKREELDRSAIIAHVSPGDVRFGDESNTDTVVSGALPDVVSWATGRLIDLETGHLTWLKGGPLPAPRWL